EGFVLLPQPLGHLADGGAAQHTGAAGIAERRFDVPRAQPPREHLHRQALELRRATRQAGPHTGDKRLDPISDLRDAILDRPLGGGEPAAAIAIAVAGARRRPVLVVAAAHGVGDLRFQRLLHDLPYGQLQQFGAGIAVGDALGQQLIKLLALRQHTPPHGYTMSRRRGGSGSSTPLLRPRSPPASSRFAVEDLHAPIDLYSWARPLLCPRHLPAHVDHPKPEAERETAIHREDRRNEVEQTSLSGQRIVLGQLLEFEKVMVEPRSNNTKQQEAHRKYTDPAKERQNYGPAPGGGSGCA